MDFRREVLEPIVSAVLFRAGLDQVIAVGRKDIMNGQPAASAERHVIAEPASFAAIGWFEKRLGRRYATRTFQRGLADLGGSIEVAFRQRGRERQRVGVVVETVTGSVGRQQGRPVNVEGQQVADCVGVFGAV